MKLKTYSYSQNPKVDTLFQFATGPQAAMIFFIIPSGIFSLMLPEINRNLVRNHRETNKSLLPMKTVILGPSSNSIVWFAGSDVGGFV